MAALAPKPPLVTAIMPTAGRPEFALQAVRYFCDQDYPNKELVVLEDGTRSRAGRLPDDPASATSLPGRRYGASGLCATRHAALHAARSWPAGTLGEDTRFVFNPAVRGVADDRAAG
jgi:hypothetical protein